MPVTLDEISDRVMPRKLLGSNAFRQPGREATGPHAGERLGSWGNSLAFLSLGSLVYYCLENVT